jgi:SnoaL-like polyketide cyclase
MQSNPLDANKTCVRRQFEELWNNGQLDTVNDFFAADFMNFGQQHQDGRTIVKRIVSVWRTAFPDLHFAMDSIVRGGRLGNVRSVFIRERIWENFNSFRPSRE